MVLALRAGPGGAGGATVVGGGFATDLGGATGRLTVRAGDGVAAAAGTVTGGRVVVVGGAVVTVVLVVGVEIFPAWLNETLGAADARAYMGEPARSTPIVTVSATPSRPTMISLGSPLNCQKPVVRMTPSGEIQRATCLVAHNHYRRAF